MIPFVFIIYFKRIEKLILSNQKEIHTSMECCKLTEAENSGCSCRYSGITKMPKFCLFVFLREKFEMLTFAWNKFPQFWNLLKMLNNRHRLTSKYHLQVVQEAVQTISEKRIVLLWISDAARCSGYSLCFTVSYVEHYLKQQ